MATYDDAYLLPLSYERAIRYTSSGVFVDLHSSFCASRLFMLTMNTSLSIRSSSVPKLHRATNPLSTEWNCSKLSLINCLRERSWYVSYVSFHMFHVSYVSYVSFCLRERSWYVSYVSFLYHPWVTNRREVQVWSSFVQFILPLFPQTQIQVRNQHLF